MTEQDKHTNIAVGMRVKLRDSDYPGHGTVTMLHPPDDRPAYRGQTWFEVRWDDWGGDEGTESDHRDTDLAPIVEPEHEFTERGQGVGPLLDREPEQPIDLSRRGLVKHISGLDDETIDRLGGVEPEHSSSVASTTTGEGVGQNAVVKPAPTPSHGQRPRSVQRRIAEQMQGDDWPLNHKAGYEPETMARVRQIIEDAHSVRGMGGHEFIIKFDLLAALDKGASNE